ncbi:efflux RND transporter periplasmic adaptor subunit [Flavobacterium sp.]|uniref:efflux RND transporter periplasmic adaptor subunit n=1 Tax=Flavobacterium sp. TaxID=239 RepID=UPI0037BE6000
MKKIITVVTIASLILTSCGSDKKENVTNLPAVSVQVSGNTENSNRTYITASGKIESENSANLSTRMMGYVTKVNVKVGQNVSAGQLLVSINNTDLQAKKAQVDASITQATAGYNNAKKDYDRFVNLFAQQSASQKELDDMTARYEMAKAGLEAAKQMRNEVMAQFSYSNITAPFSGTVTNTFVKEGDMANPGMPLVSIEGASRLQVTAMVSESDISNVKNGMPVKINVKSLNKEVTGKVSEVSLSAKNTGGQYLVKVTLDKMDKQILSGMFVNVQFPTAKKEVTAVKSDVVMIPESALVRQGQLSGIYTIGNDNVAILRWLRIGKTFGNQVEVLSGLTADEQYIVSAEGKLFNGAKVQLAN